MNTVNEPLSVLRAVRQRVADFEAEAHSILGQHETATKSRLISVDSTRRQLQTLSLQQHELFTEALACVEHGLFRAAHVAAWQAFMDYLEQKLASDGLVKLRAARPNWAKHPTMDDIREEIGEYQIIEAARVVGLISKGEMKSLHGQLSTRNLCAHPSFYRPGVNQALGYVTEVIDAIRRLESRAY
jgi:hypothetical protein